LGRFGVGLKVAFLSNPPGGRIPGTPWINELATICSTWGRFEIDFLGMQQSRGFGLSAKLVRERHLASICTIIAVVVIIIIIIVNLAVILSPAVSPTSSSSSSSSSGSL
jgi:hypothetical protein